MFRNYYNTMRCGGNRFWRKNFVLNNLELTQCCEKATNRYVLWRKQNTARGHGPPKNESFPNIAR